MKSEMSRRTLLRAGGAGVAGVLAGCVGRDVFGDDSEVADASLDEAPEGDDVDREYSDPFEFYAAETDMALVGELYTDEFLPIAVGVLRTDRTTELYERPLGEPPTDKPLRPIVGNEFATASLVIRNVSESYIEHWNSEIQFFWSDGDGYAVEQRTDFNFGPSLVAPGEVLVYPLAQQVPVGARVGFVMTPVLRELPDVDPVEQFAVFVDLSLPAVDATPPRQAFADRVHDMGDTVDLAGYVLTVEGVAFRSVVEGATPLAPGDEYAVIDYQYENGGTQGGSYAIASGLSLTDEYGNLRVDSSLRNGTVDGRPTFPVAEQGETMAGTHVVAVPADAKTLYVNYEIPWLEYEVTPDRYRAHWRLR